MSTVSESQMRTVLENTRENDGECNKKDVMEWLDVNGKEAKRVVRKLMDRGELAMGRDFEYKLTTYSRENYDPPEPTDFDVARSEEEIGELRAMLEQYPYSGGSEATKIHGALQALKWVTGDRGSFRVPRVEERVIVCRHCGWEDEVIIHAKRLPTFCPECGTAYSVHEK